MLELDCGLEFAPSRAEELLSALPSRPAVCLIELHGQAEPLLLRTPDLRRRLQRLLGPPDASSKRLNLRESARALRYRVVGSRFEQSVTMYQHAKGLFPERYKDLLRLRPAAVLKVNLRNEYPRCYVTRRIVTDDIGVAATGPYYGPFASRKSADAFAASVLDFFKVRRCQIKIRRDPSFPGCIYSEMKMCLAPCFGGCTKEEYDAEVRRFVEFLDTSGDSLRSELEQHRERASQELNFEQASALHKKIEKLDDALRGRPELPRRIQDLHAIVLQRAVEDQSIGVFVVRGGWLQEPFFLRFAELASQPRSVEQIFRERLEAPAAAQQGRHKDVLGEHLWLISRWFYSNPREGEILFREKDWPYRRILRACSRLLTPPKPNSHRRPG